MEFAVMAYDGTDEGALERRMAVREKHMVLIKSLREKGHMIQGGAILDDAGTMIGSIIICDFPTRNDLDAWLKEEPYMTGNVWQNVQIVPYKTAPTFAGNIPKPVAESV